MKQKTVAEIQVGDVILPPEREVRLWMNRWIAERGAGAEALNLTVKAVREGRPDKNGRWMIIKSDHSPLFGSSIEFTFKARPQSLWKVAA